MGSAHEQTLDGAITSANCNSNKSVYESALIPSPSDAQGAVTTQTYNLVVGTTPINQAPTITSTPKFTADINTKYQYQIVATDPENSQITYALTTAPTGMVIDTTTGLITWDNPTLGTTQILLTATDTSGAVAAQGYTLTGKQNQSGRPSRVGTAHRMITNRNIT